MSRHRPAGPPFDRVDQCPPQSSVPPKTPRSEAPDSFGLFEQETIESPSRVLFPNLQASPLRILQAKLPESFLVQSSFSWLGSPCEHPYPSRATHRAAIMSSHELNSSKRSVIRSSRSMSVRESRSARTSSLGGPNFLRASLSRIDRLTFTSARASPRASPSRIISCAIVVVMA